MPLRGKLKVDGLIFCVENDIELSRAKTLLTKEEGTIRWLQKLRPGDVFYDIGANIGCYTLYAARLVGPNGKVYAFEPHVGNAHKLLMNVAANAFRDRVEVISAAADSFDGWSEFFYRSQHPGSSGSQVYASDVSMRPVATEKKRTVSLDSLPFPRGHMIKIDVDGHEPSIICGMTRCLRESHVRSVQVEIGPTTANQITSTFEQCGFNLVERHHTLLGKKQLEAGVPEEQIVHNAVFERIHGTA